MPGFNGTGPRGLGPMTGRGMDYCIISYPNPGVTGFASGYAGIAGRPIAGGYPYRYQSPYSSFFPGGFWRPRFGRGFDRRRWW